MSYFSNQRGAVTVDWVVLTASLVGLGMATLGVVSVGTQDASEDIKASLEGGTVDYAAAWSRVADFAGYVFGTGFDDTSSSTYNVSEIDGWSVTTQSGGTSASIYRGSVNDSYEGGTGQYIRFREASSPYDALSFSRNIADIPDGSTQTVRISASLGWFGIRDGAGSVEVYFGGELIDTLERSDLDQNFNYTNHDFDIVGGSGDGSDLLELRGVEETVMPYGLSGDTYTSNTIMLDQVEIL